MQTCLSASAIEKYKPSYHTAGAAAIHSCAMTDQTHSCACLHVPLAGMHVKSLVFGATAAVTGAARPCVTSIPDMLHPMHRPAQMHGGMTPG